MKPGIRRLAIAAGLLGAVAWVSAAPHQSRPLAQPSVVRPEPRAPEAPASPGPRRPPPIELPAVPAPLVTLAPDSATSSVAVTVQVIDDRAPEGTTFGFALEQNTPNPFPSSTLISYSLPRRERVSLRIYDMMGRLLATLTDGDTPAGRHSIRWNGTDDSGQPLRAGIYLCRLASERETRSRKLTLSR